MSNFTDFFPQGAPIRGEITFLGGRHNWVVPEGVESVCGLCLGAGGGSSFVNSSVWIAQGGAGGALAWVNDIAVTPGEVLKIVVGQGGKGGSIGQNGTAGTYSLIERSNGTDLVKANGGAGGTSSVAAGGTVAVGSGGSGGGGSYNYGSSSIKDNCAGGGGAGGYSGAGGAGAADDGVAVNGSAGTGGGGGGGGSSSTATSAGHGGTVGLFGEGASGIAGNSFGGGHGSGYVANGSVYAQPNNPTAALSGAGAGICRENGDTGASCAGGNGAVRIIWGEGRAFPSTDCGQS
jgi:hypothetical protein